MQTLKDDRQKARQQLTADAAKKASDDILNAVMHGKGSGDGKEEKEELRAYTLQLHGSIVRAVKITACVPASRACQAMAMAIEASTSGVS